MPQTQTKRVSWPTKQNKNTQKGLLAPKTEKILVGLSLTDRTVRICARQSLGSFLPGVKPPGGLKTLTPPLTVQHPPSNYNWLTKTSTHQRWVRAVSDSTHQRWVRAVSDSTHQNSLLLGFGHLVVRMECLFLFVFCLHACVWLCLL